MYEADILETFGNMFANVMLECFFGTKSSHEKINNVSIAKFMNKLNTDGANQGFSVYYLLFGIKFLNLGIRKIDKDVNERIAISRAFSK